jgi:hypothetical protein
VRRVLVAAGAVLAVLGLSGCLTPLTAPQPLLPVPATVSPLLGVYEPGVPASYSGVTGFAAAAGVRPRIVVY